MNSSSLDASTPNSPINSALSSSLEQLQRCENFARMIQDNIHGPRPELDSRGAEATKLSFTSPLANFIADRLTYLGNMLEEINNSF